jgi:hypothetical protein
MAREAHVSAESEPKTHLLLRNQFSAAECATLFPKRPPKQYRDEVNKLLQQHQALIALPIGDILLSDSADHEDGQKPEEILGRFRDDFNMMLAMAIVRRVGAMAVSSGLPGSSTTAHRVQH